MPETGTSGSMSGDGKRGVGHRPQVTAPILDSTSNVVCSETGITSVIESKGTKGKRPSSGVHDPSLSILELGERI